MSESVLLAAYWSARAAGLDESAQRLTACLAELASVGQPFQTWFRKGRTRAEALSSPISVSPDTLAILLTKGQNRADMTGEVIPSLGYAVSLWNGDDVEFSAGVGRTSPWVTNLVILRIGAGSAASALPDVEHVKDILRSLVVRWDADWALALPRSLEDVPPPQIGRPRAGWVTWLRTADGGRWWTTGDTQASATPDAAAAIQRELTLAAL